MKAFVVNRVGDFGFALGIFGYFRDVPVRCSLMTFLLLHRL